MTIYTYFFSDSEGGRHLSFHLTKKGAYKTLRKALLDEYADWQTVRERFGKRYSYHDKPGWPDEYHKVSSITVQE
jgi:hypothetical protein